MNELHKSGGEAGGSQTDPRPISSPSASPPVQANPLRTGGTIQGNKCAPRRLRDRGTDQPLLPGVSVMNDTHVVNAFVKAAT